jgi:hypothetical protein
MDSEKGVVVVESKDELLIVLLQCGYADIDSLISIMEMGEDLFGENLLYDIIDEHGSEAIGSFNSIMYYLMEEIVYRLVAELDEDVDVEENRYRYILDEHWSYPYTNFMDSHFQLESLDGWSEGTDKDGLLENLKKELLEMKGRKKR